MNGLRYFFVFLIGFAVYFWIDISFFSLIQKGITLSTGSKAVVLIMAYAIILVPLLLTEAVLNKNFNQVLEN